MAALPRGSSGKRGACHRVTPPYLASMLEARYQLGQVPLANRAVMAPMTRCRAIGNIPNALMAEYYGQRASAGLIVTEGTSPSKNGLGYARIPGIFSTQQVAGWKLVTDAVHGHGGRIVVQLMHTGRVSNLANMPEGASVLGSTADACPGDIYTDQHGSQPHSPPRAMTAADVRTATDEFVAAAQNAILAGFDGIELHAANGYLLEQFLNANVNRRTDGYGGSITHRNRFVLEVANATQSAIGAHRVGIRISPYGAANATGAFPEVEQQYLELTRELSRLGLVYLHLVDHSAMGAPPVPDSLKLSIRKAFGGTLILSGGYDRRRAEADLDAGRGDLVAFGRPFIANPDLLTRLAQDAPTNPPDPSTFYTPDSKGYTDYPSLS
jgi:N-ethylmaleimide reductase